MNIRVFPAVTSQQLTDLKIPSTVALLDDLGSTGSKNSPMTAGLFRMGRGEALSYSYEFEEFKLVLEGEMTVTDDSGKVFDLKAGDLVHFSSGAKVKFSSRSSGLAFYCAQR